MVSDVRAIRVAGSMPFPISGSMAQPVLRSWTETLQLRLGRLLIRDATAADDPDAPADTTAEDAGDATAAARLEGVQLAAREIAHLVNNDLAVTVGALDLLRSQDGLSPHARDLLDRALAGVSAAAQHVRQLQRVQRIVTQETPAGSALDLDRSV